MTPPARSPRDDEDALDPVEAADVATDTPPEDPFADTPVEPGEAAEPEAEDLDETLDDAADAADEVDEDLDEDAADAVVPPDVGFDPEDEDLVTVVADDDEDEGIEGVRDGEFVCRSCFMAKREIQLADAERLLCRDCA